MITAIIPAYNEEATVEDIVRSLLNSPNIDEIIVVSDGSSDRTAERASLIGVKVINHSENRGKAAAMKTGFNNAHGNIIVFLDADLTGLTGEHIESLIQPVADRQADMSIGIFDAGRLRTDLAQVISPNLSGQRAIKREILEEIFTNEPAAEISRFGIETIITRHIQNHNYRVEEVMLKDLSHRTKEEKLGLARGLAARMKMYYEIIKSTSKKPL